MNRRQALKAGVALAALPALPAIGAVDDSDRLAALIELGPVYGGAYYLENPVIVNSGVVAFHHCIFAIKVGNSIVDISGGNATLGGMTYCEIHNRI